MKTKLLLFTKLTIFLLILSFEAFSQPLSKKDLYISGNISDADSLTPIPDVHIINKHSRLGWTSKRDGTFTITVSYSDTLIFSAVGYHSLALVFTGALLDKNKNLSVKLIPQTYEMDEVTILPYGDYSQFKNEFLALELKTKPREVLALYGIQNSDGPGTPPTPTALGSPISYLYDRFSRSAKAHRRSKVLEKTLTTDMLVSRRYNPDLVKQLTGLEGETLQAFMKFCTMPDKFILTATDYELRSTINECYLAFLEIDKVPEADSIKQK